MPTQKLLITGIFLLLTTMTPFHLFSQSSDDVVVSLARSIDYQSFANHLHYLASDSLKGRGIGTKEFDEAAFYVASKFHENGLKPFGDEGSYYQNIDLMKMKMKVETFSLTIQDQTSQINAEYGSTVSVVLNPKSKKIDEIQEIVFVGYGNIIPSKKINDYKDIDVKGKTVIIALGGPKGIDDPSFGDRNIKFRNAVSKGASGVILFYPDATLFQFLIFRRVHRYLSKGIIALADTSMNNSIGNTNLNLLLFAQKKFIGKIFHQNGLSLRKELRAMRRGVKVSKLLSSSIFCSYQVDSEIIKSKNVVSILPGSNTDKSDEYVVIGAHLDGLGIGKEVKGDSIYNGMMDNASGVAAILELSKSFTKLGERPERSLVFIGYTAEENSFLGSTYFVHKNNIQNGKIVANVNIDMLAQTIETQNLAPLGYSHSNLSEAVDFASSLLNIEIDNNLIVERRYIERTDQVSFIKKGIPSLFITGGFTAKDPSLSGEKVFKNWMKIRYHSPFDDIKQPHYPQAFIDAMQFNFLTIYYIVNRLDKITWKKDSWLYTKYEIKS